MHLVVDEAFVDFCPEQSLIRAVADLDNLLVLRSLTKFYAIPGLRVIRPADANETVEAWRNALTLPGPVALVLSRQKVTVLDRATLAPASGLPLFPGRLVFHAHYRHEAPLTTERTEHIHLLNFRHQGAAATWPPSTGWTVSS